MFKSLENYHSQYLTVINWTKTQTFNIHKTILTSNNNHLILFTKFLVLFSLSVHLCNLYLAPSCIFRTQCLLFWPWSPLFQAPIHISCSHGTLNDESYLPCTTLQSFIVLHLYGNRLLCSAENIHFVTVSYFTYYV